MCKCDRSRKLGWHSIHPNNPRTHRTQNCAQYSCVVEKERLHAYNKQCTESYVHTYTCILLLQIIIHIEVVNKTEVGWVMGGNVCAEDHTFFSMGKKIIY